MRQRDEAIEEEMQLLRKASHDLADLLAAKKLARRRFGLIPDTALTLSARIRGVTTFLRHLESAIAAPQRPSNLRQKK